MSCVLVKPEAPEPFGRFNRMMLLAGALPNAKVCTTGRSGVELMVRLCQAGFSNVECMRQATCRCADGGMDVLAIPGGTVTESLVAILVRTAPVLRDGGVVVLKLDELDDDCAVQAALGNLGLEITSTVFDLSREVIVAHTVQRLAKQALAS